MGVPGEPRSTYLSPARDVGDLSPAFGIHSEYHQVTETNRKIVNREW